MNNAACTQKKICGGRGRNYPGNVQKNTPTQDVGAARDRTEILSTTTTMVARSVRVLLKYRTDGDSDLPRPITEAGKKPLPMESRKRFELRAGNRKKGKGKGDRCGGGVTLFLQSLS